MINWLGRKCPRDYCNGDLFEELDQFLKPVIQCFLCSNQWDAETGKLLTSVGTPTLRGLKMIEHGIER